MKDDKKATELYTMACKHNPKGPSCDKIGGTSKRLEFFCTEKKRGYSCVELADTYYRNDLEKSCIFITKLANSDLNVPAARLLISPSKKKLQKNKNLLATKKRTAKLASR